MTTLIGVIAGIAGVVGIVLPLDFTSAQPNPTQSTLDSQSNRLFYDVKLPTPEACTEAEIERRVRALNYQPHASLPEQASFLSLVQCNQAAVPALITALRDPDQNVRSGAAIALGQIGLNAKTAVPALTNALYDESAIVRTSAAYALGQTIVLTGTEISPQIKVAIDGLIGKLRTSGENYFLDEDIDEPNENVRIASTYALGQILFNLDSILASQPELSNPKAEELLGVVENIYSSLLNAIIADANEGSFSSPSSNDVFAAVDAINQVYPDYIDEFMQPSGGGGLAATTPGGSQLGSAIREHLEANRPAICQIQFLSSILPRCQNR